MKRQKVLSFFSLRILWETPHLVFLTAMLLCGALAGSCTGLRSGHSEGALLEQIAVQMVEQARIGDGNVWMLLARTLAGALAGSCTGLRSGHSEGALLEQIAVQMVEQARIGDGNVWMLLARTLAGALAWQGAAILCGMLRGHSLLLSGLCAARGFLLSFAAGAFLSTLQLRGLLLALITGGVSAVVTVPCLLLTASACFLAGQDAPNNRKGYWYALARACFLAGQDAPNNRKGYWYALARFRSAIALCTVLACCGAILRIPMLFLAAKIGL